MPRHLDPQYLPRKARVAVAVSPGPDGEDLGARAGGRGRRAAVGAGFGSLVTPRAFAKGSKVAP